MVREWAQLTIKKSGPKARILREAKRRVRARRFSRQREVGGGLPRRHILNRSPERIGFSTSYVSNLALNIFVGHTQPTDLSSVCSP